jgi:16S rRNA (adenine1518-N6/adenine1519-N6)-dimethyltransferase
MVTLYQEARAALRTSAFHPKKRLGQNFLVREDIVEAILRLIDVSQDDEILEIGPGLGFLTRRLVNIAREVWAVEVDAFLAEWLRKGPLGGEPDFHLIHNDILKVQLADILPDHKIKLVANLPYSIFSPILFRLFEFRDHFSLLVLMVQREVAERMAALPGTKSYGTLSVWCQIHGQILDKVFVSPEAFFPRPKVKSAVLKIGLYPEPLARPEDFPFLHKVVRAAFGLRRKTLTNALSSSMKKDKREIETLVREQGIDPRRRGETLSVAEFIRLARSIRIASEEKGQG